MLDDRDILNSSTPIGTVTVPKGLLGLRQELPPQFGVHHSSKK